MRRSERELERHLRERLGEARPRRHRVRRVRAVHDHHVVRRRPPSPSPPRRTARTRRRRRSPRCGRTRPCGRRAGDVVEQVDRRDERRGLRALRRDAARDREARRVLREQPREPLDDLAASHVARLLDRLGRPRRDGRRSAPRSATGAARFSASDHVRHAQRQGHLAAGLHGDPLVGVGAGQRQARLDGDEVAGPSSGSRASPRSRAPASTGEPNVSRKSAPNETTQRAAAKS